VLDQGTQLELRANYTAGGIAAQQLLVLTPGHYILHYRTGASSSRENPKIRILCRTAGRENLLVEAMVESDGKVERRATAFGVPASGCAEQWLRIEGPPTSGKQERWIDDISVVPA
ncbi:hypothetical protein VPH46_16330, partial [Sphingomonas sp. MJ1 (PH-R8)]|uniref:hypothetical protein n=1 Tax=Sphingomonas sp. MJ1 (PH-R8) TaxID=3112950 RepID=UPI003A838544